eukprot:CAMPEP_0201594608 /NCGR_PEP_ID=MMETSP0190_2-20130828/191875_1 /ASSEMBLY_ACC=CAM_ASM_000263 /TAXON_ID=37353 /ORGANISM="Rosalina sp." /LENGTH=411 /DNA_ID=CAMNT_0048054293 /DNA_START=19 /DNA_END=1254 /DNA_ORIENTATION=+
MAQKEENPEVVVIKHYGMNANLEAGDSEKCTSIFNNLMSCNHLNMQLQNECQELKDSKNIFKFIAKKKAAKALDDSKVEVNKWLVEAQHLLDKYHWKSSKHKLNFPDCFQNLGVLWNNPALSAKYPITAHQVDYGHTILSDYTDHEYNHFPGYETYYTPSGIMGNGYGYSSPIESIISKTQTFRTTMAQVEQVNNAVALVSNDDIKECEKIIANMYQCGQLRNKALKECEEIKTKALGYNALEKWWLAHKEAKQAKEQLKQIGTHGKEGLDLLNKYHWKSTHAKMQFPDCFQRLGLMIEQSPKYQPQLTAHEVDYGHTILSDYTDHEYYHHPGYGTYYTPSGIMGNGYGYSSPIESIIYVVPLILIFGLLACCLALLCGSIYIGIGLMAHYVFKINNLSKNDRDRDRDSLV